MKFPVVESVNAAEMLRLWRYGERVFCREVTPSGRLLRSVMMGLRLRVPDVCRLEIGHVESARDLRQQAYEAAERSIETLACVDWINRVSVLLGGVDVRLLVEKMLFEQRYDRCLFQLLCLRLTTEHPGAQIYGVIDASVLPERKTGELLAAANGKLRIRAARETLSYLAALIAIPLLLVFHWGRYARAKQVDCSGQIVCSVDAPSTCEMMHLLFGEMPNVRYVIEPQYERTVAVDYLQSHAIGSLRLSASALKRYAKISPNYLLACIYAWRSLRWFGYLPLQVLHMMIKAESITPSGVGVCFITSGHLTLERAARNELLRLRGSASVNISSNSYVTYQQYPAEWRMNYAAFAASGQHAIDLYTKKRALSVLLLTGSFDMHRPVVGKTTEAQARKVALERFVGDGQLVVVLSPGICDETYSNERRLMAFAADLGRRPNTKVVVRCKPGVLAPGYERFYEDAFRDAPDVRVTSGEFDLLDFLGVASVYVTSISTSACDIALRGGVVQFIDFMQTNDLYLPWAVVPGIVSSETDAYERIDGYLSANPGGLKRQAVDRANSEFARYLGCRFEDFARYKSHLLAVLAPWLAVTNKHDTNT
jgi:hypothetical protein